MAIYTQLMPHQNLILDFISSNNNKYFGIFADYGTGKTLCSLAYINKFNIRKTLVISTKTAIEGTWPAEVKKHSDFRVAMLLGTKQHKLDVLNFGLKVSMLSAGPYSASRIYNVIFLVNFDGIKNIFNELIQADFDLIVIDESTKIKSPKSLRTKIIWALGKDVPRKCIMTGFPITENLSEIYAQIKFLDNGTAFGNSFFNFLESYFNKMGYKYVAKKKGVDEILTKIKPFCIRVSGDVLKLPPKVYIAKDIEMTNQQIQLLTDLTEDFRLEFGKVKIDTQYIFTIINKSLQICDGFIQGKKPKVDVNGEPIVKTVQTEEGPKEVAVYEDVLEVVSTNKDEMLLEIVDEIDPRKNKVIIWFNYIFSLKKTERLITKALHYKPLTLYGETENVTNVVNAFQHGKSNILLATQKKASASITLTNCRQAIYYSTNWSAEERYNSEARIYRKGSEKHDSVVYTDLVTRNTVEELVNKCLKEKKNLVDELKKKFGGIII